MKAKSHRRRLPLETWQSDQWEVPIQTLPVPSTRASRTIKLARFCVRPDSLGPRKKGPAPRLPRHPHHTLSRLVRKLKVQRLAATGGVS